MGAQAQAEVFRSYLAADLFLLASRIAGDGDRDGLPNVLMEAQSQRLPCLATRVSAIPELIEDGVTGVLAPPQNPEAFAPRALGQEPLAHRVRREALELALDRRPRQREHGLEGALEPALAPEEGAQAAQAAAPLAAEGGGGRVGGGHGAPFVGESVRNQRSPAKLWSSAPWRSPCFAP